MWDLGKTFVPKSLKIISQFGFFTFFCLVTQNVDSKTKTTFETVKGFCTPVFVSKIQYLHTVESSSKTFVSFPIFGLYVAEIIFDLG